MSGQILALLPDYTDTCGCSLLEGRCQTHAAMMRDIHAAWNASAGPVMAILWNLQDGYGPAGSTPVQGMDWSGIRDSSTDAIEAMWRAVHA